MKIAIMQPYFLPYIGYFQLIKSVDKFIIYDDVNYIKQGWINRNNILLNGSSFQFTIPVEKASSFKKINNTKINKKLFERWKVKFFKTLSQAYIDAPNYSNVKSSIEFLFSKDYANISDLNVSAIIEICKLCKLETEIVKTSTCYQNENLSSVNRVIDICKKENASTYINPIGGIELYDREIFSANNIQLSFLYSLPFKYNQNRDEFISNLSIIDLLMFADKKKIRQILNKFEFN